MANKITNEEAENNRKGELMLERRIERLTKMLEEDAAREDEEKESLVERYKRERRSRRIR